MKTLNKTLSSLTFTALMLFGLTFTAEANCKTKNCSDKQNSLFDTTKAATSVPFTGGDEFDFDFSEPFFFTDKVVINVYGTDDQLLYSGSFTREEMKNDQEVQAWLKKSEFLLSIDNQHYYFTKE